MLRAVEAMSDRWRGPGVSPVGRWVRPTGHTRHVIGLRDERRCAATVVRDPGLSLPLLWTTVAETRGISEMDERRNRLSNAGRVRLSDTPMTIDSRKRTGVG